MKKETFYLNSNFSKLNIEKELFVKIFVLECIYKARAGLINNGVIRHNKPPGTGSNTVRDTRETQNVKLIFLNQL